jgi:hypothetical protein
LREHGLDSFQIKTTSQAAQAGSAARPCGRNQNNESQHPPLVDDLGVETLCLRGSREMLQECLLNKQEITSLQCRARAPAPRLFQRGGLLPHRKQDNLNFPWPRRQDHGAVEKRPSVSNPRALIGLAKGRDGEEKRADASRVPAAAGSHSQCSSDCGFFL